MTTLAILADIHGNLPALEAVLGDMQQFMIDHVVVAGDVINWGPFSRQVVQCVTREGWAAIRGNNEFYLLDYETPRAPAKWNDREQFPLLPWLRAQLGGHLHHVIAAWPDALQLRYPDAPPMRIVHGSPRSAWEPMHHTDTDEHLTPMLEGVSESVLVSAHTHIAMDRVVHGTRILNGGSVGVPLDGNIGIARYLLLMARDGEWQSTFRSVPFDLDRVLDEFKRQCFVEQCGVIGQLIVEEFQTARMRVYPFLKWRTAHYPVAPLTPELLAQYAQVDAREFMPMAYRAVN